MTALAARIKRLLPRGRFARNVAVLAGGAALGQAASILAAPILTRLYAPADFGVLNVYVSALGILLAVGCLRYEYAIALPEADELAVHVMVLAFTALTCVSALFGVIIASYGASISLMLGVPEIRPYLWLLPISLMLGGAYQVMTLWGVRKQAYPVLARTRVQQGVGALLVQGALGWLHGGPLGLLLGDVFGRASGTLAIVRSVPPTRYASGIRLALLLQVARRYVRFPLVSAGSSLVNSAGQYYPPIVFAAMYGSEAAGWLFLAVKIFGLPLSLVGHSVGQVFLGHVAQRVTSDPRGVLRLHASLVLRLLLLGSVPAGVLMLFGPDLFALVFGSAWREAGMYARLLALTFLFQLMAAPLSTLFDLTEEHALGLIWDFVRIVLVLIPLYAASALGLPARSAVAGYAVATVVCYALLIAFSRLALKRKARSVGHA